MPGYDLVATNPANNTSARIQAKSRWRTESPGFLINNFNCDFVFFTRLNRGSKNGKAAVKNPEFFVFYSKTLEHIRRTENWDKILLRDISDLELHRDRWDVIKDFLADPHFARFIYKKVIKKEA
jgi:hypothetical protein